MMEQTQQFITEPSQICYDRILPDELRAPMVNASDGSPGFLRGAGEIKKLWDVTKLWHKQVLRIHFMQAHPRQDEILHYANQWSQFCAIQFTKVDNPNDSDIRIGFKPKLGSWSFIGTDCTRIAKRDATMNLGFINQGTVIHEFGHALGLIHEHERPKDQQPFEWNKPAVIKALSGPPNYWDKATIQRNMFQQYDPSEIKVTDYYDPKSIMHYGIPADWILGTKFPHGIPENTVLSDLDKQIIAEIYPRKTHNMAMLATPSRIVPSYPACTLKDQTLSDNTKAVALPVFESHKGYVTSADLVMVKFHTKEHRPYKIVATAKSLISLSMALLGPKTPESLVYRLHSTETPKIALALLSNQDYYVRITTDSRDGGEFTLSITAA